MKPLTANVDDWQDTADWSRPAVDPGNIWAPRESDWALMGPEPMTPWSTTTLTALADTAVQLSLALLNHHPERSGFCPVLARYQPDCEENGDEWKGWAKYMVYKLPPSPSPLLALPSPPALTRPE